MRGLACVYVAQGRYEKAERLLLDMLETKNDLAVLYKEQGWNEKAEPLLIEAVEGRRRKLGDKHPHTLESWHNLMKLYEACGKPEKAAQWRAKLPR